jgi:hypothetical protein
MMGLMAPERHLSARMVPAGHMTEGDCTAHNCAACNIITCRPEAILT